MHGVRVSINISEFFLENVTKTFHPWDDDLWTCLIFSDICIYGVPSKTTSSVVRCTETRSDSITIIVMIRIERALYEHDQLWCHVINHINFCLIQATQSKSKAIMKPLVVRTSIRNLETFIRDGNSSAFT